MMKRIAVMLVLCFVVLVLSGCYEEQVYIEPHLQEEVTSAIESSHLEKVEESDEIAITQDVELLQEPILAVETVAEPKFVDEPEVENIHIFPETPKPSGAPSVTPKPQPPQTPVDIPKPAQASAPASAPQATQQQVPASTPKPAQQQTPKSQQTNPEPTPTPQPQPNSTPSTPESKPTPAPTPTPKPEPVPIYEERSICSCGVDITGNTTAHMKNHALNDDGHGSWRSEMRIIGYR